MNCPNCHQTVEADAAFCGNCGQQLRVAATGSLATQMLQNQVPANLPAVPGYALATPSQHTGETIALLSLLFGLAGVVGALFMALLGLGLGTVGIVMGTLSRSSIKRGLSTAGLIISSVAIVAALAVWAFAIQQDSQSKQKAATQNSAPAIVASNLSTPCYSVNFVDKLNVSNSTQSCNMKAFNGQTIEASTDAYKVYANQSAVTDAAMFTNIAKTAIDKDVKTSLPSFDVTNERVAAFAGSPAYAVLAVDTSHDVAVVEEAVYHKTTTGNNIFVLVHAVTGTTADVTTLEAQWQWK